MRFLHTGQRWLGLSKLPTFACIEWINASESLTCSMSSLLLAGLYSAVFCLVVWHLAVGLTAAGHHMV